MGIIVVLSGGMDSTTLLWYEKMRYARATPFGALSIDYGQRHRKELESAKWLANKAGCDFWEVIDLSALGNYLKGSSQTDETIPVPHGHYADESMKKTVVPNRNMIMLSVAAGYAAGKGIGRISFAAHAGDHAIYPDCRPDFVESMNATLKLATEWHPVSLDAPFVRLTKSQIVTLGHGLGVPFGATWSCYEGGDLHCGKCGTCVERREAFALAGVPDPTIYKI